jgi:hypothetical protein
MKTLPNHINRSRTVVLLAICAGLTNAALAQDLDPNMRQLVIASCSTDAYRLCPQSLGSEKDAVSCMASKRRQLGQICRVAYDKAARVLAR